MTNYVFKTIESDDMCGGWMYCNHKRGSNWLCIATGKNAANVVRVRCKLDHSTREYDVSDVKAGDALECGAEYTTSGGRVDHDRRYYSVVAIIDRGNARYLTMIEHDTLARAMRARGQALDADQLIDANEQLDAWLAS
jgi:hypothetical protein